MAPETEFETDGGEIRHGSRYTVGFTDGSLSLSCIFDCTRDTVQFLYEQKKFSPVRGGSNVPPILEQQVERCQGFFGSLLSNIVSDFYSVPDSGRKFKTWTRNELNYIGSKI